PFRLTLALPWLADILTGVVYYFAAILVAPRDAPWNVSHVLGLATAFACSLIVHIVPEFEYALLAIAIVGAFLAVAAWGSFITGRTGTWKRRIASAALAITLLIGLLVAGTAALNLPILALEILGPDNRRVWYEVDRQGRVLIVRQDKGGRIESVTDLNGFELKELRDHRMDHRAIEGLVVPLRLLHRDADSLGYRSFDRAFVPIENESSSTAELWYYLHDEARLFGYEQRSKRLVGSLGPDGFVPTGEQPAERFVGKLFAPYGNRGNDSPDYLAFPSGVYTVDFAERTIQKTFTPSAGETVLTAHRYVDQKEKRSLAYILTDKALHIVDEAGETLFSSPLIRNLQEATQLRACQLEAGRGYVVWYGSASWWSRRASADTNPSYLVQYDANGRETARHMLPPLPFAEPSMASALTGFVTPVAGYVLRGCMAQYFGDQAAWSLGMARGTLVGFTTLMLLSSVVCAVASLLFARRCALSLVRCLSWSLCGFLFGPAGLLLTLALNEWP
ncbi:MAG: hypothetical protein L0Z53_15155, partial [Acidobacteriales bacterium]|nr:hypothetical protein [Terriglobales bacterium]